MDINKIVFFNHFHNGDIHLSRELIKHFIKLFPDCKYVYGHNNSDRLLLDISNLQIDHNIHQSINAYTTGIFIQSQTLYVNTWIGAENKKFLCHDCVYPSIYDLLNYYCETLQLEKLGLSEKYIPNINFSYYDINPIDQHFKYNIVDKNIFIVNGQCHSGQCQISIDFVSLITSLSSSYPNYHFYVSNFEPQLLNIPNVFMTDKIIDQSILNNNLNETAYITTFCDIIIGRPTGAWTFALNQTNFNKNKTFISLVNQNISFNGFETINKTSKFIRCSNINEINQLIK